jgi:hypothetical protein
MSDDFDIVPLTRSASPIGTGWPKWEVFDMVGEHGQLIVLTCNASAGSTASVDGSRHNMPMAGRCR